ncbi:hypothetical protein Dehly_1363 [Dehalogenimonas lykanthroporepellens BL-DC-9]|nr:hypothetical protein Dehly_1363 [Dehalogenimonas lykanthroporepellens BL-DC-9]
MSHSKPTKGGLESLLIVNILASLVFIAIIAVSGQYLLFAFWVATAVIIALAWVTALIPHRLRVWRWVILGIAWLSAMLLEPVLPIEQDISTINIVFLLAIFWLPLIHGYRQQQIEPNRI